MGKVVLKASAKLGIDPTSRATRDAIVSRYTTGLAAGEMHQPVIVWPGSVATLASGDHWLDHNLPLWTPSVPAQWRGKFRRASGLIGGVYPEGLDVPPDLHRSTAAPALIPPDEDALRCASCAEALGLDQFTLTPEQEEARRAEERQARFIERRDSQLEYLDARERPPKGHQRMTAATRKKPLGSLWVQLRIADGASHALTNAPLEGGVFPFNGACKPLWE